MHFAVFVVVVDGGVGALVGCVNMNVRISVCFSRGVALAERCFAFLIFLRFFSLACVLSACRLRFFLSAAVPVINSVCARRSCSVLALPRGGGCIGLSVVLYLNRDACGVLGAGPVRIFFRSSLTLFFDSIHSLLIAWTLSFATERRHVCLSFALSCSSCHEVSAPMSISMSPSRRFSKMCLTACLTSLSPRKEAIVVTAFRSAAPLT